MTGPLSGLGLRLELTAQIALHISKLYFMVFVAQPILFLVHQAKQTNEQTQRRRGLRRTVSGLVEKRFT